MAAAKKERQKESHLLEKMGQPGDVDFQRMIRAFREQNRSRIEAHDEPGETKITICVRKRPVNAKETKKRDFDAVTCLNPMAIVHDCKLKVDGITKYLDSNAFRFDHVRYRSFHEALADICCASRLLMNPVQTSLCTCIQLNRWSNLSVKRVEELLSLRMSLLCFLKRSRLTHEAGTDRQVAVRHIQCKGYKHKLRWIFLIKYMKPKKGPSIKFYSVLS